MVANVYAVVGDPGSGRAAVALDLAGALQSRGNEVALIELDPGPPDVVSMLDLSLAFVGRPTVETALGNGAEADGAVTRVAVEAADATLGLIPTPGERDVRGAIPVEGLEAAVEALSESYDVVVLDVDDAGVSTIETVGTVAAEAIVTTGPDEESVARAGEAVDRLDGLPVVVGGLVLTECESEAQGWRAKARLDPEVLTTFPPRDRASREELDEALRTLVENLLVGGGIFTDAPPDEGGTGARSILAALDAGGAAEIVEAADRSPSAGGATAAGGDAGGGFEFRADSTGGETAEDAGGGFEFPADSTGGESAEDDAEDAGAGAAGSEPAPTGGEAVGGPGGDGEPPGADGDGGAGDRRDEGREDEGPGESDDGSKEASDAGRDDEEGGELPSDGTLVDRISNILEGDQAEDTEGEADAGSDEDAAEEAGSGDADDGRTVDRERGDAEDR